MKLWIRGIYCGVLGIIFSGCANLFFNPALDSSLATLENVKVLPDVSSVAFEWDRFYDANLDGFAIYRKSGQGEFKLIDVIRNPLTTHFYDKGLKPESIYSYQFAILGKNNTISERSRIYNVKTSFIQPIDTLFATNDEPRLVKLVWSVHPNPSIEKYVIEKKIKDKWVEIGEVKNRLGVEYFDSKLLDGTTYEYRVVGVSFQGDRSRVSEVVQATTKFPPPPIENISTSNDIPKAIELQWNRSEIEDLAGYIIYASQKENGSFKKIAQITETHYIFRTEKNAEQWFFKVVAIDQDGIQGLLTQTPVRGISRTPPPPPIIKGASIQDGQAVIGWERADDSVSEIFVYRKGGGSKTPLKFKLNPQMMKFIDKEMQKGVEYVYWVEFVDGSQIPSSPSREFRLKID